MSIIKYNVALNDTASVVLFSYFRNNAHFFEYHAQYANYDNRILLKVTT